MNRSVYSLVLMDSIVDRIDQMAYMKGTSRSNLINQILAEYVSLTTPEMRMKEIFSRMEDMISQMDSLKIQPHSSDAMMSMRSVLRVKYNPTVRYSIELYREARPALGALRVSSRTQNRELIEQLDGFFALWAQIDAKHVPSAAARILIEDGRFAREFTGGGLNDGEAVADALTEYVRALDKAMKCYFLNDSSAEEMERIYLQGGLLQ